MAGMALMVRARLRSRSIDIGREFSVNWLAVGAASRARRRPARVSDLRKLLGDGPPDLRILAAASHASLVKSAAGWVVP